MIGREKTYCHISGWMLELGLRGNDLLVYAILYGFTMGDRGRFVGDLEYLAGWTGTTEKTVRTILQRLEERGLISCEKVVTHDGWHNEYTTTDGEGMEKISKGGFGKNFQKGLEKFTETQEHNTSYRDIYNLDNKNGDNKTPAPTRGASKSRFDFRQALIDAGVSADVADAWMAVRKTKKATNTQVAFEGAMREVEKTGASADQCIRVAAEQSWSGFRADWFARLQAPLTPTAPAPRALTFREREAARMQEFRDKLAAEYAAAGEEYKPFATLTGK